MRLVLSVGGGTAHRALAAVLAAAGSSSEVAVGGDGLPRLDVEAGVVHLADRRVAVVLTTPAAGEVGVVEDLLVVRAWPDVPGEATVLAELGELAVTTLEDLRALLGAAALARAAGVAAEHVRAGLVVASVPRAGAVASVPRASPAGAGPGSTLGTMHPGDPA